MGVAGSHPQGDDLAGGENLDIDEVAGPRPEVTSEAEGQEGAVDLSHSDAVARIGIQDGLGFFHHGLFLS